MKFDVNPKIEIKGDLIEYGIKKEVVQLHKILRTILKKSNATTVKDLLGDAYFSYDFIKAIKKERV